MVMLSGAGQAVSATKLHLCVVCARPARSVCQACLTAHYCGPDCQLLDWLEQHAGLCEDLKVASTSPGNPQDDAAQAVAAGVKPDEGAIDQEEFSEQQKAALATWKRSVRGLWALSADDDLRDLAELGPLLALTEPSQNGNGGSRLEMKVCGARPVLVTAPHSMCLHRDGQDPHVVEKYTAEVAQGIAATLGGSYLGWSETERRKTELLWSLSKRLAAEQWIEEIRDPRCLDPRNRDPNYLSTQELAVNRWFQHMIGAVNGWRRGLGPDTAMLHIDVHGCRNPPGSTSSHLTIGIGAMCLQADSKADKEAFDLANSFGKALEGELAGVLSKVSARLHPRAELVRVSAPGQGDQATPRFSGACNVGSKRHTQTQQAMTFAGFTHAVQLELSKSLRAVLAHDDALLCSFGNGLRAAWAKSKQGPPSPRRRWSSIRPLDETTAG